MKNEPATDSLRILHLEDDPHDMELVRLMLEEEGIRAELRRVATRKDFEAAVSEGGWHLVISDFTLPSYDGLAALALTREKLPQAPFILFSGTIGEEMAVQSLKSGATDYVLKQRPARLIPAVRHALEEAAERRRRRQAEEELRKSEERQREIEAQLLRMQRMSSIGTLAGGIAHDLNNALVPVFVGIGLLAEEPLSPPMRQVLATMEASVKRGVEMLRQVLTFSCGIETRQTLVEVDLLLREMDKIIKDIFPKSIGWQLKLPSGLWPVSGYATQLHQVLMNLCLNARDAMPYGGRLTLVAENVFIREEQTKELPDAAPGQHLVITISDTGGGMTPDILKKLFQPFFTTKAPGKGTGLGLSTSLNIVKNHGGFITVKSEPGAGSEFKIYLPATPRNTARESEQKHINLPAGAGQWILVVDDETAICEIAKIALENYGYHVLVAGSGPEAVAMFSERHGQIKVAITDTSMPFMDGQATCLAMRKIEPALKIIATSGNGERKPDSEGSARLKVDAFVQKPYTIEKLLTTVHQMLNEKG